MVKTNQKDRVLIEFCDTIEAAGGVARDQQGLHGPVGDPEWVDLGEAYRDACLALDRLPKITTGATDEE
jgi:hypothetical protein